MIGHGHDLVIFSRRDFKVFCGQRVSEWQGLVRAVSFTRTEVDKLTGLLRSDKIPRAIHVQ